MADLHSAVELGSCKKVPPGLQELDFRAAEELALFRLALGIIAHRNGCLDTS